MTTQQWAGYAADAVVLLHLGFILFVVLGGLLLIRWKRLVWLHLPAALWGALIEFTGWICPLTPLENRLRYQAGLDMYESDFVTRYIMPVVYPPDLTRDVQLLLGIAVLLINALCYYYVFHYRSKIRRDHG